MSTVGYYMWWGEKLKGALLNCVLGEAKVSNQPGGQQWILSARARGTSEKSVGAAWKKK